MDTLFETHIYGSFHESLRGLHNPAIEKSTIFVMCGYSNMLSQGESYI